LYLIYLNLIDLYLYFYYTLYIEFLQSKVGEDKSSSSATEPRPRKAGRGESGKEACLFDFATLG